jgi:histidyl-tRNA synthetase
MTACSSLDKLDKNDWEQVQDEMINVKGLTSQQTAQIKEYLDNGFKKLLGYAEVFGLTEYLEFEPTLARGMDYYIPEQPELGTVMAGGRYDGLTKMFSKSMNLPAIGISVGFERLFRFLVDKQKIVSDQPSLIVYIAAVSKNCTDEEIITLNQLSHLGLISEQKSIILIKEPLVNKSKQR